MVRDTLVWETLIYTKKISEIDRYVFGFEINNSSLV